MKIRLLSLSLSRVFLFIAFSAISLHSNLWHAKLWKKNRLLSWYEERSNYFIAWSSAIKCIITRLHWRCCDFNSDFKRDFTAISNRPCKLLAIPRQFDSTPIWIASSSPRNLPWNRSKSRQCKWVFTEYNENKPKWPHLSILLRPDRQRAQQVLTFLGQPLEKRQK